MTTTIEVCGTSKPLLKVERAYHGLRRLIITLDLWPGTPLDERDLMERLDIGRTPLREAMLRLAHERLIVHTPRRGAQVSELSIIDLRQMIQARMAIEPLVMRGAAENFRAEDRVELEAILAAGAAAFARGDLETGVERDLAFHGAIARRCGNSYFADFSQQLNTSMLRYWHVSQRRANNDLWFGQHLLLLDSLTSKDGEQAAQACLAHIANFRDRVRDLLV